MARSLPHRDHFTRAARARTLPAEPPCNAFVDHVYAKLSPVYDVVFGAPLHAGRVAAIRRMAIRPGDRVLEVGVGTGLNAPLYPRDCQVTGVDLSAAMLERARERMQRQRLPHIRLLEADAAALVFADDSFDTVCAPYVVSAVPDPVAVVREMRRVCRPGGRIVILNHFRSANPAVSWIERLVSPLTVHVGFRADLDLPTLLRLANLHASSIEKVNVPPIWSLVTCIKE